jgi:hypothetical protein
MQECAEGSRGREPRRCGVTAPHRLTRHRQILEDRTVWWCARGPCGHPHFHTPGARGALGPQAALAPEDPRSHRPLGGGVRRFPPGVTHTRPPGLRPRAHLPTDPVRRRDATGLSRCAQPCHLARAWPHRAGHARVGQRAVPEARPPVTPRPRRVAPRRAERVGTSPPREHGVEMPRPMGPAALAPPGGRPRGPTPAVGAHPAPQACSPEVVGPLAAARPPDHQDCAPGRDRRPQPRPAWSCTPPRCIPMGHRWRWDLAPRCRDGCRHRLHGGRLQVHHGSQTPRPPPPIRPEAWGGPSRPRRRPRAQGRTRLHARATSPQRHPWGPRGPAPRSTGGADHARPRLRGDDRRGRWACGALLSWGRGRCPRHGRWAVPARRGLDRHAAIALCPRQPRPGLPLMTGLPARSTPPGRAAQTCPDRLGRLARRWARCGARGRRPLLPHLVARRLQRGHTALQRADVGLCRGGEAHPDRWWSGALAGHRPR